jgi:hypothetical protein
MLCQNADLPGVFADVDSDEQLLTGKVEFCNLGSHHKPRFVCGFGTDIPNVRNKVEAYAFLNIRSTSSAMLRVKWGSENKVIPLLCVIARSFACRSSVKVGAPYTKERSKC